MDFAATAHLLFLFCGQSSAEACFFNPQKLYVSKVSMKNFENIKIEFSALSTPKKWYDMNGTHNFTQRTVDPKLVADSET